MWILDYCKPKIKQQQNFSMKTRSSQLIYIIFLRMWKIAENDEAE